MISPGLESRAAGSKLIRRSGMHASSPMDLPMDLRAVAGIRTGTPHNDVFYRLATQDVDSVPIAIPDITRWAPTEDRFEIPFHLAAVAVLVTFARPPGRQQSDRSLQSVVDLLVKK